MLCCLNCTSQQGTQIAPYLEAGYSNRKHAVITNTANMSCIHLFALMPD